MKFPGNGLRRAMPALLLLLFGAFSILPAQGQRETERVVEVEASGASMEEARRNAVRAALQMTLEQLVLADRKIENGQLVRERLLSTVNGFIQGFEVIQLLEREPEYLIRARVTVAKADIENYVDYLGASKRSGIDGESIFGEIARRKMQASSLRRILRRLVKGVPLYRFSVNVDEISPADPTLRSPYHQLPGAQDAVDAGFSVQLQEGLGRSLHAFAGSLEGVREWVCSSPRYPIHLDWHDGSFTSAWHQCAEPEGDFRNRFSVCSTEGGQDAISCTTVQAAFSDGEPMYSPRHAFATPRNFELFLYAFTDQAGRSTHSGSECGLLTGRPDYSPPDAPRNAMGMVYPLKEGDIHLWQTTSTPFAVTRYHAMADTEPRWFFARIPVHDVDLQRTSFLEIGLVYLKPNGRLVTSLDDNDKTFAQACNDLLSTVSPAG